VQNPTDTFDSVGDLIHYNYIVTNTGSQAVAGPVTISDNIVTGINCPALNTIGNQDDALDPSETLTCTGSYSLTQAALDARSVTNVATASAAGGTVVSAQSGVMVAVAPVTPGKSLGLAKTANPLTYNQEGQTITYTYVITNTGTLAVGPAQLMIRDDRVGAGVPFTCGPDTTVLEPGQTVSCTGSYVITRQDMGATSVTNTATASGGDAQASAPASATVTNSVSLTPEVGSGPSNLTPGTNIQHTVVKGEWMIQLARCYGVRYESLRNANLNISNPSFIEIGQIVNVPNIGSAGTIYGPPCVVFHTVVSGDTWNSIATQYNARVDVLQEANPGGLVVGTQIKVPINSAGAGAVQVPLTGATSAPSPTATQVTPTPTLGTAIPGFPTRITFPPGQTSTMVSGTLEGHGTVSYVLTGSPGQTMTLNLSAPANEIALRVYDPNGMIIKALDANPIWTGPLSANGDYRIDLVGLSDPNKNYTLTVAVTGP
jgi:LysM repeat protein